MKAAGDAYTTKNPAVNFDIKVSGTDGGFDKFCLGAVDINMATKGITDNQLAACAGKAVDFVETLLGYDAAVLVVRNDAAPTCLSTAEIGTLLSPAASAYTNWSQVNNSLAADAKLGKIYTSSAARALNLMVPLVVGGQPRTDIQLLGSGQEAIDKIPFEPEAVALVTYPELQDALAQQKAVKALDVKVGTGACTPANPLNFELNRYPVTQPLYLYTSAAGLGKPAVVDFLKSLTGDGKSIVTSSGFTIAADSIYARNQSYLEKKTYGRTFSRIQAVNIAADTQGTIQVGGAAQVQPYLKPVIDGFTPRYSKITVTTSTYGNLSGYQKFCANQLDIIGASRPPTEGETAACKAANVTPLTLSLGSSGAVLVVSAKNTYLPCLTTDQVGKLIGSDADGKIKKWSDLDPKLPATDILFVAPNDGNVATDLILLKSIKGVAPLPRRDVTQNDDPLYRAAGVAVVDGAITWMSYSDYVKANNPNVKLISIDAGKGCIAPDVKTIGDGTYAYAEAYTIQLNQAALGRPEVKAFVWYLLSEDGLTTLQNQTGLTGFNRDALANARDTVLELFNKAPTPAPTPGAGGPTAVPTVNLGLGLGQTPTVQPTVTAVNK
jgi:phosphate transport system substrate-binding protein